MKNEDGEWSPRLVDMINQSAADGGRFLTDLKHYEVLEVYTKDAIYQMVVVDKENSLVAVTSDGEHITEPEIWCLVGSTWGSSVIKRDFVGVNMRLEMQMADSRRTLISMSVDTIKIWDNPRQAAVLAVAAKENRQRKCSRWRRFLRWCSKLLAK